jgi:hypothetical protein
MKIFCFCIALLLSLTNSAHSQAIKKPIDFRFKGGEHSLVLFISENIKLSGNIIKSGLFGNSITKIVINPKGELIDAITINPIDSAADKEVIRVIELTRKYWKADNTLSNNQVFYLQVCFSRPSYLPGMFKPKSGELLKLFPEPIIIPLEADFDIPFIKSEELSNKANSNIENGNLEQALFYINELIKRDPFERDLYKTRIMINIKLNRPFLVEVDENRIIDFADGFSLDDLFKSQYN